MRKPAKKVSLNQGKNNTLWGHNNCESPQKFTDTPFQRTERSRSLLERSAKLLQLGSFVQTLSHWNCVGSCPFMCHHVFGSSNHS